VAHLKNGTLIKGYLQSDADFHARPGEPIESVLLPDSLTIVHHESGKKTKVEVPKLKAIFFVKTFTGSTEYTEIKFFKAHPLLEGLWVRLTFQDNEKTEGVIYNSMHFLLNPGFFLKPPDPNSNNEIVYVLKSSLRDFRILGVRNSY